MRRACHMCIKYGFTSQKAHGGVAKGHPLTGELVASSDGSGKRE